MDGGGGGDLGVFQECTVPGDERGTAKKPGGTMVLNDWRNILCGRGEGGGERGEGRGGGGEGRGERGRGESEEEGRVG